MKLYEKEIKEKRVVEKILITLTEKYDSIVASIETSSDPSSLSISKLVGLLGAHEARLNNRVDTNSVENAFQSKLKLQSKRREEEKKRKILKNILKAKILEIYLEAREINILYVAFAISQVMQKKTVGIVGNQYVIIARSMITWRSIVAIKISIKQTLLKNTIRSNVYPMLIKNLIVEKETGTWTVDAAITWPKIKAFSKTLINLSMSKFDLEMAP